MGRILYEDKMRIQTLHEQGLCAKAIRLKLRYPAKQWSLNTLKTICRRITKTGSAVSHQSGSGRPKSARDCAEHRCCRRHDLLSRGPARYEQKFPSNCQNAWNERQIRLAHREMDLELSAFRRMQVLSDAVELKRLERCRALLRRLTVNKVKQVFFTDEKNFYLNPPVSKSVSNFINFYSSWKIACICDAAIATFMLVELQNHTFKFRQP